MNLAENPLHRSHTHGRWQRPVDGFVHTLNFFSYIDGICLPYLVHM